MNSSFLRVLDPNTFSRFSDTDAIPYKDIEYKSEEDVKLSLAEIVSMLDRLPSREADIIRLHFIMQKKQVELAKIFRITQAAISYRINRAIQRIKFLLDIPKVDPEEMEIDLAQIFKEDFDVQVLCKMYVHTCQSQVAKELSSTQCYVRHRFLKAIDVLEQESKADKKFQKYYDLFSKIKGNFNILREIKLPHWDKTNYHV